MSATATLAAQSPIRATHLTMPNSAVRCSPRISRRPSKLDVECPSAERVLESAAAVVQSPPSSPRMAPHSPRSSAKARKPPTPRGARLNVRDNRKEAIVTSSTLDFVSLSACDEEMVQECDKAHTQTETRKRSICTTGASDGANKRRRSMALQPVKSPSLSSEDPSSDELGGFELRLIKLPTQRDPVRPQSSRGGDSRAGDSRGGDSPFGGSLQHGPLPPGAEAPLRPPSSRPPSSLFGHGPAPRVGSALAPGWPVNGALKRKERLGNSARSEHSRSSLSLSGMSSYSTNFSTNPTSRPSRTSTETPPCAPNAFESHAKLVKCTAPQRPSVHSRLSSRLSQFSSSPADLSQFSSRPSRSICLTSRPVALAPPPLFV